MTQEKTLLDIEPWMNMRQLIDLANALTLLGLVSAVACAILAISDHLPYAVVALMISGVCDLFDGVLARRCNRSQAQAEFGGRLDTIVDVCSFGFAPVVLMYCAGLRGIWEVPLLLLFVICVVWRLAFFDLVGLQIVGNQPFFVGLPVTYVAMFLPLAFLAGFGGVFYLRVCVAITIVGLAMAMISTARIRKPSGVFYILFPASGLILMVVFLVFADRYLS